MLMNAKKVNHRKIRSIKTLIFLIRIKISSVSIWLDQLHNLQKAFGYWLLVFGYWPFFKTPKTKTKDASVFVLHRYCHPGINYVTFNMTSKVMYNMHVGYTSLLKQY